MQLQLFAKHPQQSFVIVDEEDTFARGHGWRGSAFRCRCPL
jgi:hypothetical protein